MQRIPFVPGENSQPYGGGSVVLAQTGDSGYSGAPPNGAERIETNESIEIQDWSDIQRGLDERLGINVPNLSSIQDRNDQINPKALGQGVIDQVAANNSLISAEQVDVSALASQYDKLVNQLQGQYRLAETEEEKQRLRYMLADIEAQYDAGKQTIGQVYSVRKDQLAARIEEEKVSATDWAQRAGNVFTNLADESEARLGGVTQNLSEKYRGLGLEPVDSATNEWTQTIRALDPIQTTYLTEIGNSRVSAMNRSLESLAMQEMAQIGDFERLKAQTTSSAQYQYLEGVEQRINSEYESMRRDMTSINLTKISATQSALEFNASMRDRAASRMQQEPDPALRYEAAKEFAAAQGALLHNDPEEFERQFRQSYYGENPDDTIWYEFLASAVDSAETQLGIASDALTNFGVNVYSKFNRDYVQGAGDDIIANIIQQQFSSFQRDYDEAYELYRTYGGLLKQIEARR